MKFQHHKHGDQTDWKVKFAWFPVSILDIQEDRWYTVWLERYCEKRTYIVKPRPTKFGLINMGKWDYDRTMIKKV